MSFRVRGVITLAVPLMLLCHSITHAKDYSDELAKVKRVEAALKRELPDGAFLGSMYHLLGVEEQKCAVLARVLGLDYPKGPTFAAPTSPRTAYKLAEQFDPDADVVWVYELTSRWIAYEKTFSQRSRKKNVTHWNLSCAGAYPDLTRAEVTNNAGSGADFTVSPCVVTGGNCMQVLGTIEVGMFDRLRGAIIENDIKSIAFGSGGGAVVDALKIGRFIRSRGIDTDLYSNCYSACALAFLGGKDRQISNPADGKLGFHQVSMLGKAVPASHKVYRFIRKYATDMGANPDQIISFIMSATPDKMHYPDFTELCPSGATHRVYQMCDVNW